MLLLHAKTLERIGRIPRSSEHLADDALELIDKLGPQVCEVFLVSHNWLQPSLDALKAHPDTPGHDKARAIIEFATWRKKWVLKTHKFEPEILFWIDYACFDQDRGLEAGFALLPLWVACCERVLCIETDAYHGRAWCRLELLLSHCFSFADHQTVISLGYRNTWPATGTKEHRTLLDPADGAVTNPNDRKALADLVAAALAAPRDDRPAIVFRETATVCFTL
jgi:hypothetical protein